MDYDVSLQTISWINERRDTESLEISPKFQRRAVWLIKERSELMATICSQLPFPEIYIHVVTDKDSGKQKYIVVDGQQRITSILLFIDGEISLPNSPDWEAKYFRELSDDQKTAFWDYKVVVRMLRNTNDAEIRDLFGRLNTNNVALNDQELRNAKYTGKFKQAAERLADNPFFQNIGLFTAREVRRMEDIEFVSELLLRTVVGLTNKKDLLDEAYAMYNEDFPGESQHELEFNAAINLIQQLTTDANQTVIKTKSNFYSIFGVCLLYYRDTGKTAFKHPDKLTEELTTLLQAARSSRTEGVADPIVAEYFDAVSRAASDKSRRARREEILWDIVATVEQTN